MNLEKLKQDIECLSKAKHIELLRILKENNIEYSENKNGVFFNLSELSPSVIKKIYDFTNYLKQQEELLHSIEKKREECELLL
jgi:hypothetical protein